jgi:hypothetical protein
MKRINHALRYRDVCRWLVLALALGGFQVAHAQSTDRVSAAEFGRLWGPALDPTGATQVRNFPVGPAYPVTSTPSITAETGGGLAVSKTARFPVDPSRVIDVTAKAPISKAAMGKAFKLAVGLSGGPLGLALFAASEIADWMAQANLRQDPANPSAFQVKDASVCTVAPCYQYYGYGNKQTTLYSTVEQACASGIGQTLYGNSTITTVLGVSGGGSPACNFVATPYYSTGVWIAIQAKSVSPAPGPSWIPATPDQIEQAAASPTMKPEWLKRILDSGVPVDAGMPTLSGPSSVSGPSSSSTKQLKDSAGNVTGTQTVNQSTVYNITYNGNTYNVNSVTTTTTVNPDGTSTVQTETAAKPTEKDPATDCDKYPSSLGCTDLDVPDGTIPKTTKNIAYTAETWFGGGTCPADKYLTTHGQQIKVWDWQSTCSNLVTYFRPVLLIVAAVMAMFIVLPKGAEV